MRAITISRAENLPIGELSRLSGVNIETIRYYEKIKILPAPPRTESSRRIYGPNEGWPSFAAHASLVLLSGKSAACWRLAPREMRHVVRFAK
jgi:hypothetical protein